MIKTSELVFFRHERRFSCLDSMYSYEKLFWRHNIYERVIVAVSKQKDSSYPSKQRTPTRYNPTISNARIYSRMKELHIKTHPYAALECALEAYTFNNNINKSNKNPDRWKHKTKTERSWIWNASFSIWYKYSSHTTIRMSWRRYWFQRDSGLQKKTQKKEKRLSSLINLIRTSSIMDVSNHKSGNLLSCCVKDSPLGRGSTL